MTDCLTQYFRCPEKYVRMAVQGSLSDVADYFRFGTNAVCYGRYCARSGSPPDAMYDAEGDARAERGLVLLPFDLEEVVRNLRHEAYTNSDGYPGSGLNSLANSLYYAARPLLPVAVRKHLQRIRLNGWRDILFPRWPVDRTVDDLFEQIMLLVLRAQGIDRIPFIWFWPNGVPSAAILTHDVESAVGRDFSSTVMDIDDSFAMQASFQVVPENRYQVLPAYLESIRRRGFEVAVQDLNHDGHLYRDREEFLRRADKINSYGRQWGAEGFRAAILYRRQEWFDALDFAYDMSVPNVAHLDPQHGGCCTVMPYFVGKMLELPVTTTQDYSLFHILRDHSIDLWKQQIELIMEKHGLLSFIVHPDYVNGRKERLTYEALLGHLAELRDENNLWIATPGEVNKWWRQRAAMTLVESRDGWKIEGDGHERALIAYASEDGGQLRLTLESASLVRQGHHANP